MISLRVHGIAPTAMPEGDVILKAAARLGRVLAGRTITGYRATVDAARADDVVGRAIARVEAHGKNLFIHLDDGRVLHSHMKMTGRWDVYRAGDPWTKRAHHARVVIEAGPAVAVCFDAPVVALLSARRAERLVAELGPDVLAEEGFDARAIAARLRRRGDLTLGEALMHQGLLAGIGNVYKSEVLFVCRLDPWARIDHVGDDALVRVVEEARALMQKNVRPGWRRTRPSGGHWVYGRQGLPCAECGTTIAMKRQGDAGRSTYFCPRCQASDATSL